jgi:hypothetical protein
MAHMVHVEVNAWLEFVSKEMAKTVVTGLRAQYVSTHLVPKNTFLAWLDGPAVDELAAVIRACGTEYTKELVKVMTGRMDDHDHN